MLKIGIDPGAGGGIAVLVDNEIYQTTATPKIGKEIDIKGIVNFLREIEKDYFVDMVIIEDVHAIFGTGAKSTFNFGRNLGIVEGVIAAMGLPYKKVKAKAWQKVAWEGVPLMKKGSKKDTKAMSRLAAERLFPKETEFFLASERSRVPHDGIVDAILIAYGG